MKKPKKRGSRSDFEIELAERLEKAAIGMSPLNQNNMTPEQKIELIDKLLTVFQNLSQETIEELNELKRGLGGAHTEDSGGSNPPGQPGGHP